MIGKTKYMVAGRQVVGSDREDQSHGGWEAGGGQ